MSDEDTLQDYYDVCDEYRERALAAEARVALLETALGNLRDCFVFHTIMDEGYSGMIACWTTKASTGWGNYEERGVPANTVEAIRLAYAVLPNPVPGEEPTG